MVFKETLRNVVNKTSFFISFVDFFLPRICPVCNGKLLPDYKYICPSCIESLKPATDEKISYEFGKNFKSNALISGYTSIFYFEKDKEVQNVIHSVKYGKKFHLGVYLGEFAAVKRAELISLWKIDLIVPVPLHKLKKIERGFNQSDYIARGFSLQTGIPYYHKAVKRIKFTRSQTTLKISDRKLNLDRAFTIVKPEVIKDKIILLIDDVSTTGTTLNECAKSLLKSGASKVYALTIAVA
jgi:ComF family protein